MFAPRKSKKNPYDEYPDDIFKDSRMSFGDHIEELRTRMIRAIKWLLLFLIIGFVLDGIGQTVGNPKIGIGKPMIEVITDPVESQVRDFYDRRADKVFKEKLTNFNPSATDEQRLREIRAKLYNDKGERVGDLSDLTSEEIKLLFGQAEEMTIEIPVDALSKVYGSPKEGAPKSIMTKIKVYPAEISSLNSRGSTLLGGKQYLSTLSVQEGFVVYFKVSLLCGVVLASPFILYQFWMFIAAGMYPHEKRYVYVFFGPSVVLFILGVLLCQFVVLPGAVKALLKFNEWLGFDPDIRLREWLSLAIILPLVFGISFQTPLVMVFLNRIGMFTAQDYLSKWRHACMILAIFAAVITPTPDAVTMCYLFVPMFALYMVGIVVCHYFPGIPEENEVTEAAEEVAV